MARIQSALMRLRFLEVPDAVAEHGHYGLRTAAAVLAYKQAFQIINRRYQTQADNIVGRMTIASLDHAIWVLDGAGGAPRAPSWLGPHPRTAKPLTGPSGPNQPPVVQSLVSVAGHSSVGTADDEPFVPPLSEFPADMQATIRRSNDAKKPDDLILYPFVDKHEGSLPAKELSARFGLPKHKRVKEILFEVHTRMKPFDIWRNIRIITSVGQYTGAYGLYCWPFDFDAFLAQMTALTKGSGGPPTPYGAQLPIQNSKFCRDTFNVHGPRDSFREIVKEGPGLHICITQPAERSNPKFPCDLHIDEIQQGQLCSNGWCVPIVNGQTIGHLYTVGPWLAKSAKEWIDEQAKKSLPKW
ncbi:MAG TPA: hypothetical protein VH682_17240 [Gemmataceae bacterium]